MKTKMFKKMSIEEKTLKFEDILRNKTNGNLSDEIIKIISRSVDIENQYQINVHYNDVDFLKAAMLYKTRFILEDDCITVKEEATILYGAVTFGYEVYCKDYVNNTLTDLVRQTGMMNRSKVSAFKKARCTTTEKGSVWYYSIEIYIPNK